ncbi:MAG: GPW/gp25 family protein [Desulfosarcinaceae bacterium]|nr:GPW/gp25 family protein [Desulfosarcinaceae bacterium]
MNAIAFPYTIDSSGRTARSDQIAHVREMITQILFTTPGERVNRPDFGSGLMQAVFAGNSDLLAGTIETATQAALQRWLDHVIDVDTVRVASQDAILRVHVAYTLKLYGEPRSDTFEIPVP